MFSRLGFGGSGTPKKADDPSSNSNSQAQDALRLPPVFNGNGPVKALRLVYTDDKGRFRMDAEAVAALQLVKGPIGVVSVCGRARQGKSFILNQLLGRSGGFQVGPTHRPCTKGLWMWSAPLKRIAADGSEYNLLLLDSEGIDAYDQTGTYSTQIFSLAVLLSSMFVYNQMGGIDEAAIDRLSLVTEMTKHIRVRAQNKTTADELGQFSPVFLWLLRDFYLDLNEDGRKITPREYLESALQPMVGTGKAVHSKNEIRESIRALFPDRHCFTLVRPVNNEQDLQRLDLIPMERMRSEFRMGLESLTKFILERTRPKQVGSTVMTGPVLAGLTQSFLDAINAGAVPTIATSWQNVEENECRRAYDMAMEAYVTGFDKTIPPEQAALQEAYDRAVQSSVGLYNSQAVGVGPIRMKYENQLKAAMRKHHEEFKQKALMEAELKCLKAVEAMEEGLRNACAAPNASYEQALQVLGELISQYERTVSGPTKWQKLAKVLQQSLEGPFQDLVKRTISNAVAQASGLELRCRSMEDRLALAARQTEAAQREALDWKKRYEAALADYKSTTEVSAGQYATLQSKLSKLEERRASMAQQLEASMKEAYEWQNRLEHTVAERRSEEERHKAEFAAVQSRCTAAEARLAAAREQSEAAKEEAAEWRRKHDAVVSEARSTAERYNALRERGTKHSQQREDALRVEFNASLTQKEALLAEAHTKLEQSEHAVTDLRARLQGQESKLAGREAEVATLREEVRKMQGGLEAARAAAAAARNVAEMAGRERAHAEEKAAAAAAAAEAAEGRAEEAEREARRAGEEAEVARASAAAEERERLAAVGLALERLAAVERAERAAEAAVRERAAAEAEAAAAAADAAASAARMAALERRIADGEAEAGAALRSAREQRANTVQVLEGLLASERAAHADASGRAEALSLQLQNAQARLDALQHELATTRLNEAAMEARLRTPSSAGAGAGGGGGGAGTESAGRAGRHVEGDHVGGAVWGSPAVTAPSAAASEGGGRVGRGRKRARVERQEDSGGGAGLGSGESPEQHGSTAEVHDYRRLTINMLKQEITKAGYGAKIMQMKNAQKKDFIALYEEVVLHRG